MSDYCTLPDGFGHTKLITVLDGLTGHERLAIQGFGVGDRFIHQSTHDVDDVKRARDFLDAWIARQEDQQ